MQEHSLAKAELYSRDLEKYLSVLCNSDLINKINIFDLFCGERAFKDGNEGSPIVGFKKAVKMQNYSSFPITPIYGFAKTAFETEFSGSDHLKQFLIELFDGKPPTITSTDSFIEVIKKQFKL